MCLLVMHCWRVLSLCRLKHPSVSSLELSVGNDVLRLEDDKRLVSSIPLRDRMVRTINYLQVLGQSFEAKFTHAYF